MINALLTMSMTAFEVWISFDGYNSCFDLMLFIFFCSTRDSDSKKKELLKRQLLHHKRGCRWAFCYLANKVCLINFLLH